MFKIGEINHNESCGAVEERGAARPTAHQGRLVVYRNNRAFIFGADPVLNLF